ncbi:hypothetical protein [uncultured Kriegella sp.]|uniref:hypothetical protein n=1 Tax=uncultured Kriegella sp. TaxID=1798910 RepID=UPI0030DAD1C2|tara:strand:- start:281347 stop:281889 length:543 start_codon:yes stop_codon:yes gene_type:complete
MKKYILLSFVAILAAACNAQEKNSIESNHENELVQKEPKGTWRVTKELDEKGNLIRYDSIYSWSSSEKSKNIGAHTLDSLNQMVSKAFRRFGTINGNATFPDFFNSDSLFGKDLFHDNFFDEEFFRDRFYNQFSDRKKLLKHMDSLQREFLEKYNFQQLPLKNEEDNKKKISPPTATKKV